MRWEPYTKNKDVPKEKWKLIDELVSLYDPPVKMRTRMRQIFKGCTMEGLESRIKRMKEEVDK